MAIKVSRQTVARCAEQKRLNFGQLSLQLSGFRVKARRLGHRFEEKVFMYQVF